MTGCRRYLDHNLLGQVVRNSESVIGGSKVMALQGPIPVEFGHVLPDGVYAAGAFEPVRDFDASSGDRFVQSKDKASGLPLWVVEVIDADLRGNVLPGRPARRHRSTRRRQDAPDLPRRKVAAQTIYQHEARGADQRITDAIDSHVQAERGKDDDDGAAGALVPAG
jgi:hypothetical protein